MSNERARRPIVRKVAPEVDWARATERGILDYIAPDSFEPKHKDHVVSGPLYARHLAVIGFPATVSFGYLLGLFAGQPGVHVTQVIDPLSLDDVRKTLGKSRRAAQATIHDAQDLAEAEVGLTDVDRTSIRVARGQERLYRYGIYIQVTALSEAELKERTLVVRTQLHHVGIETVPCSFQQKQAFDACLPAGIDPLERLNLVDTSTVTNGYFFDSSSLTGAAQEGRPAYFYGLTVDRNRQTGGAVLLDPFDEEAMTNPHAAVLAKTGAGKSYLLKDELVQALQWGRRYFVIDPEHEYQALAEELGGTFIRIAAGTRARINPFDLPRSAARWKEDEEERNVLLEKVYSLAGWLERELFPHERLSRARRAQLETIILETYRAKGITADPATHHRKPPILEELLPPLERELGDRELVAALQRLTSGTLAMFNGETNQDLDKPLVVYGFRDIDPTGGEELLNLACLLAFDQIWTYTRNRPDYAADPVTALIDEGWLLLATTVGGQMLANTIRRGRKYNLRLCVATQKVGDVVSTELGRTLLNMCHAKFLLEMEQNELELAAQTFRLTAGEVEYLQGCGRTSEYSDCLLLLGKQRVGLRILRAPVLTHRLITTKPGERTAG